MRKTLTEQWREGTLRGCFYWKLPNGNICTAYTDTMRDIKNVRDSDEVEVLQETPSYVEYKQLLSKTDELVQKIHILNEQNTKQYNELCEEIKKNNILEKKLEIATKALKEYADQNKWSYCSEDIDYFYSTKPGYRDAEKALEEMEGVK